MKNNYSQNIILALSILLITLAPLFRAGNRPIPLLILEIIGLAILLSLFWNFDALRKTPKALWALVITIIATPLVYLMPSPDIIENLAGRELYNTVEQWIASNSSEQPNISISLIPEKTLDSLLSLIPVAAIFLATMSLSIKSLKLLCYIFLGIVAFEGLIALAQVTNGSDNLYFGMKNSHNAQGTYPNRDHFSALLEMSLPVIIGLLAISFAKKDHVHHGNKFLKKLSLHETLTFSSLSLLIFLAAIFSYSRSGIFLIMLGIFISTLSFARHIGGKQSIGLMATLTTLSIGVATSIGIIPIVNRFITLDPLKDGRNAIFEHTIEAIQNFYPVGSGPGTFPYVYRAFQPMEQAGRINHAHNDYLELILETGLLGAAILCLFLILYLLNWKHIFRSPWLRLRYIQTGAGIGMLLILLHGLSDFNFHIPANMIFFALLAGIFFHYPELDTKQSGYQQPKHKANIKKTVTTQRTRERSTTNPFSNID